MDEVRVEIVVDMRLLEPGGDIALSAIIWLYEGAGCETRDLDGRLDESRTISAGRSIDWTMRIDNEDEGGDYAWVTFDSLVHTVT